MFDMFPRTEIHNIKTRQINSVSQFFRRLIPNTFRVWKTLFFNMFQEPVVHSIRTGKITGWEHESSETLEHEGSDTLVTSRLRDA